MTVQELDTGFLFVALPWILLLAAFLVCESVQWLIGRNWRDFRFPRPTREHSLALRDAVRALLGPNRRAAGLH